MKIAVVGCGALGSYYGAKLSRAGHGVHFLLRGDYAHVRRHGVRILSPEGDFHVQPRCAQTPDAIGESELVLVALKTTANGAFGELLPALVGRDTAVVCMQNGLGNEAALADLFEPRQVLGGLCFVCLNREGPGVIRHVALGRIVLGEFAGWPEPRTHELAALFRHAGVPCEVTETLERARWMKLVWNIAFNGCGVASAAGIGAFESGLLPASRFPGARCLRCDELLADPRWETHVRELMLEVIGVARALGHAIEDAYVEQQIELTRRLGSYAASTLVDFEHGRPLETESLFAEPLRQALKVGVAVPRLERLYHVVRGLEAARA